MPSPKLRPICLGHSMKTVKYLCCDPCTFSLSSHLAAHSIQPSDPKVMAHRRCTLRRTWCVRGGTGMFTVGYHEGQMVNLPSGDVYFMRYWIRFDWIAWKHPRSTCHAWYTLRWRHNEHEGVSNHQPHDCLLNRLSRRTSKKTSKLCVTGLCEGNSPGHDGVMMMMIFKHQLGCRFDILDSISSFFLFWHIQLYMSWYSLSHFLDLSLLLKYSLFFQVLLY